MIKTKMMSTEGHGFTFWVRTSLLISIILQPWKKWRFVKQGWFQEIETTFTARFANRIWLQFFRAYNSYKQRVIKFHGVMFLNLTFKLQRCWLECKPVRQEFDKILGTFEVSQRRNRVRPVLALLYIVGSIVDRVRFDLQSPKCLVSQTTLAHYGKS